MGVDYDANYGIGVRVFEKEFEEGHEWENDFLGYLDDILDEAVDKYSYFEVGSDSYGGDPNDFYVIIDEPFSDGFCGLEEKAKKLLEYLEKNEIEWDGEVDIVGGLNIW